MSLRSHPCLGGAILALFKALGKSAVLMKRVLLGVTGGVAAYKAAELTRELMRAGCEVQVVMTASAQTFVTPMTFQALSGKPVRTQLLDEQAELGMGHIELARWADAILIAPASANSLARMSAGMADDLLTTVVLASTAPLWFAPAMNQAMWHNPMTQENIARLLALRPNTHLIEPASGEQACGDVGVGRLPEPSDLAARFLAEFQSAETRDLEGLRVVITSGPTRERLDPVRYLSNDSSGKMGYALAAEAARRGAQVILVSGPVSLPVPEGVQCLQVESAEEMLVAVSTAVDDGCDWFIAAAAVADYRPVQSQSQKIKKSGGDGLRLELVQNPDILASVASRSDSPYTVGFAAETEKVLPYAKAKRQRKRVDLIVANDVGRSDIGFNSDHNEVWIVSSSGEKLLPYQPKLRLAGAILDEVLCDFQAQTG